MEIDSAGGGKRFLPSSCVSWKGNLYGEDKALLRQMLLKGHLQKEWGIVEKLKPLYAKHRSFIRFLISSGVLFMGDYSNKSSAEKTIWQEKKGRKSG